MCRLSAEDGCTAMVATPHLRHEQWWNADRSRLETIWRRLSEAASDHLEVLLGGEIAVNSESFHELGLLPAGDLLPLAGSRYLLLELDPRGLGPDPEDLVHELTVEGWLPILAHPERISWLARDLGYLRVLVDQGALVQLTAMSVTGDMGRLLHDVSDRMLDAGLVHFVASDCHDSRIRRPGLSKAYHHVAQTRGEELARQLFVANPTALVQDRPLASFANEERAQLTIANPDGATSDPDSANPTGRGLLRSALPRFIRDSR